MKKIILCVIASLFFLGNPIQNGFVSQAEARGPAPHIGKISGKKTHHAHKRHAKKVHKTYKKAHRKHAKIGRISGKKIRSRPRTRR